MKYLYIILFLIGIISLNRHFNLIAFNYANTKTYDSFRLMTYNANGVSGNYGDDKYVADFLSIIDSISPQVLVLQEMRNNYSSYLSSELKKKYSYNSLVELAKYKYRDRNPACFFSIYPIKSFCRLKYNQEELDSVYNSISVPDSLISHVVFPEIYYALIEINNTEVLIVCCYLKTNDYSKSRQNHSDSWIDGIEDYINGYRLGNAIRCLDAKMIRDSIARYDLPTIVCGDMNDFQFSRSVRTIMGEDLKNVWWERGMGYGMTYNRYHLKLRIDHILVSKEFEPVSVMVPHLPFSDHYPIVADMKLR